MSAKRVPPRAAHLIARGLLRASRAIVTLAASGSATLASSAAAQTDYYNTDAGRPIRIEDAYSTERYAFELQLASVRAERVTGGIYTWGIEPEIAYGVLPRTHIELGVPLIVVDAPGASSRAGAAGVDISVLHNLNAETAGLPAMAVAAHALVPAGPFGPERAIPSLTAIVTRTFTPGRVHLNAQYTFADDEDAGTAAEASEWLAGIALDRALPLRSLLLTAEAFAEQPLENGERLAWTIGGGMRVQRSPHLALDAGLGRRVSGRDTGWYFTVGAGYAFAVRALMPGGTR